MQHYNLSNISNLNKKIFLGHEFWQKHEKTSKTLLNTKKEVISWKFLQWRGQAKVETF